MIDDKLRAYSRMDVYHMVDPLEKWPKENNSHKLTLTLKVDEERAKKEKKAEKEKLDLMVKNCCREVIYDIGCCTLHIRRLTLNDCERLGLLVKTTASELADSIPDSGHRFAMSVAASIVNPFFAKREVTDGLSYVALLKNVIDQPDKQQISDKLKEIADKVFNRGDCSLRVLAELMSWKYLHGEIREKGGAYGAGALMNGPVFCFHSYRWGIFNISEIPTTWRHLMSSRNQSIGFWRRTRSQSRTLWRLNWPYSKRYGRWVYSSLMLPCHQARGETVCSVRVSTTTCFNKLAKMYLPPLRKS
ncbi:uncharacterized protein LOC118761168 [Octopus sinensis]|uniref:Uncharacterized protein LOC118761168 n=1 Tax=Octopus sinensis TaxID=2607531 RepID=A0A7E6EHI3_9MOLL|nr:uncharacterized protein LOC118761168 [Octopus sinensis]